jgi:hypothetical protein
MITVKELREKLEKIEATVLNGDRLPVKVDTMDMFDREEPRIRHIAHDYPVEYNRNRVLIRLEDNER